MSSLSISWTEDYAWETLDFRLILGRPLTETERKVFEEFVRGWYLTGAYGGFGGSFHYLDDFRYGESPPKIDWFVDMGDSDTTALTPLVTGLGALQQRRGLPFAHLVIGDVGSDESEADEPTSDRA